MIKIIQTIVLTAVVFSPLSLISLVTSATAHHTSSHVSTTATAIKGRKKAIKKLAKPSTSQQKSTPDATAQPPEAMPSSEAAPAKSTKPDVSNSDKMKPSGGMSPKPVNTEVPPAGAGMPTTPATSGGGTPTLPTTIPTTK